MNMAPYHTVLVHFPIALWMTASLAILIRAFSDSALAKSIDHALLPLLVISLLSGILAFSVGLTVWPFETISASAIGRNHLLMASWTVAFWTVILVVRWVHGEQVWIGTTRWIMAGLALIGSGVLGITGTLGGHLTGNYTDLSAALRALGWEVYTTYYLPDSTLTVFVMLALALVIIGVWGRSRARV